MLQTINAKIKYPNEIIIKKIHEIKTVLQLSILLDYIQ